MILTVIRGLPGSGKSTFARNRYKCLYVEDDMYYYKEGVYNYTHDLYQEAFVWLIEMVKDALDFKLDVTVGSVFPEFRDVATFHKIADQYGAQFHVLKCVGDFENIHSVNEKDIQDMKDRWDDYPGEIVVYPEKPKERIVG